MSEIRFRSDMTVELVDSMGSDESVVRAARVSTRGAGANADFSAQDGELRGLINYLMRNRHMSPFEHGCFTFYIEAPIFVAREFMRHRTMSFNEESGRYRELSPVFYVPGPDRKLVQKGKPGAYEFVAGTERQHDRLASDMPLAAEWAYTFYLNVLDSGIAREVARMVLPVNIYTSWYATVNPRNLMAFLSLRVDDEDNAIPTKPMAEIQMVAEQMELYLAASMPATYAAWVESGRR